MLNTTKKVMEWLCVLPADKASTKQQRISHCMVVLFGLTIKISCVFAHLIFFVKNIHTELNQSLFALLGLIGVAGAVYVEISGVILRNKMATIFEQLSDIHDAVKSARLMSFLTDADATCESLWKIYPYATKCALFGFPMLSLSSVFYCWWINDGLNVDQFYHPLSIILPWNQTTYCGYIGEITFGTILAVSYGFTMHAVLILFISMCIYHVKFLDMFDHLAEKLDNCSRVQCVNAKLCDMIRFRISVQNWFYESAKVYSPFVLVQLISNAAMLSISAYYLDSLEKMDNSFFVLLMASGNAMCTLFLYCYSGAWATISFEKMSDVLFELNWQDLPVVTQKDLILMIADMQKSIHYKGFGVANLDLLTFGSLIRAVGTYFMLLKTITSK